MPVLGTFWLAAGFARRARRQPDLFSDLVSLVCGSIRRLDMMDSLPIIVKALICAEINRL